MISRKNFLVRENFSFFQFYGKNFVKLTVLLKKVLNGWFDEFFWWESIFVKAKQRLKNRIKIEVPKELISRIIFRSERVNFSFFQTVTSPFQSRQIAHSIFSWTFRIHTLRIGGFTFVFTIKQFISMSKWQMKSD